MNCIGKMLLVAAVFASEVQAVIVPGTANPWLAGMPNGSVTCCGDSAPAQSPVLFGPVTPGALLSFNVTGSVSTNGLPSGRTPDGSGDFLDLRTHPAENGLAGVTVPFDSLLGVFLDGSQPNLSGAPDPFGFFPLQSHPQPDLKQVFFIGDGYTLDSILQEFRVPAGATRLFLGTMSDTTWSGNSGSFDVTAVPEPTAVGLAGLMILLISFRELKRRRLHPKV